MSAIGILVALPDEGRTLIRRRLRFESLSPLPGGHWLAVSGAGPESARRHAEALLDLGVKALISWGCAAALHDRIHPGQLLLPQEILGEDGQRHAVDPLWHQTVCETLRVSHAPHTGLLVESSSVVATAIDKRALHQRSGAIAVDMESAALARTARSRSKPFLVIRSVADAASLDFPPVLLKALNPRGDARMGALLGGLALRPQEIPELMALGKSFKTAMNTLASARDQLGEGLSFPDSTRIDP